MIKFGDEIRSGPIPDEVESFVDHSGDRARRMLFGGWEVMRESESNWRPFGGEEIEGWIEWPIMVAGVKEPKRKTISLPEVPDGMDLIGKSGMRYTHRPTADLGSNWWVYGDDEALIHLSKMLVDDAPLEIVPALPPVPTLEQDIALVRGCLPRPGPTYDAFQRMVARLEGKS